MKAFIGLFFIYVFVCWVFFPAVLTIMLRLVGDGKGGFVYAVKTMHLASSFIAIVAAAIYIFCLAILWCFS